MKTLKICKASAGSGKTFKLAVEYIKHLIKNPQAYRHILAVTFTNKATAEMKERILSQLYGLSRGLDDSKDYMEALKSEFANEKQLLKSEKCHAKGDVYYNGKNDAEMDEYIRKQCGIALSEIIHNFHRFRIETIDSFFQSIVRELAHDLDLTANLRVDLDNKKALQEGVTRVIDSIVEDKEINSRVFNYVYTKMDDNKNWTVSKELQTFGENIFNENFLEYGEELRRKLDQPGFIPTLRKRMRDSRTEAIRNLNNIGNTFFSICSQYSLTASSFTQASKGVYSFFEQIATTSDMRKQTKKRDYITINSYTLACLESVDNWSKKDNVKEVVKSEKLDDLLRNSITAYKKALSTCVSIDVIETNLNNLSLVNTISKMVQAVKNEHNEFLLANTSHFLSSMIDGSDVPFIYERTGTRFDHIMIDEFQDTSVLQWKNFKPLISNSLDSNHECLIVGDVKQSIYRWRNGDWSILNTIKEDADFKQYADMQPLDTNYRSCARIIKFNNYFFEKASYLLEQAYDKATGAPSDDINKAYEGCSQKVPDFRNDDEGFVRIELMGLEWEKGKMEEERDESEMDSEKKINDVELWYLERLATNIEELLKNGVTQNNICILARNHRQIKLICDFFDKYVTDSDGSPIKIVSAEAYELGNSPAVNIIITALRALQKPDDRLNHSMLTYHYQTDVKGNNLFADDLNKVFLLNINEQNQYLPNAFTEHLEELSVLPIYELCERLYSILELGNMQGQDSYLFAFFDYLTDFLDKDTGDIDHFLKYWEDVLSSKTISDGAQDGISIMTIHKAKGLEFHSVIIPFCDWKIETSTDMIWCVTDNQEPPFNELPLTPVGVQKGLIDSIFCDDYKKEVLKQYVDNLNLIYVGFTRASKNLIVISGHKNSSTAKAYNERVKAEKDNAEREATGKKLKELPSLKPNTIATVYDILSLSLPDNMEKTIDEEGNEIYKIIGSQVMPYKRKDEKSTDNVLLMKSEPEQIHFRSGHSRAEFRQSNNSQRFINGENIDNKDYRYQNEGLLFHEILSHVNTEDDIDKAVMRLDFEGCFVDPYQRENVKKLIKKVFNSPICCAWFDSKWHVINEQSILFKDENGNVITRRPDRVITDGKETIVIDYKTGIPDEEHERQVRQYMELLEKMGLPDVKGYIWYIRKEAIVEVIK